MFEKLIEMITFLFDIAPLLLIMFIFFALLKGLTGVLSMDDEK